MYNAGDYEARLSAGMLRLTVVREGRASSQANQPPGTRSQLLAYSDSNGQVVARVHRYLRPDGSIGASGKPDPKYLLHEGVIYKELSG